MQISRRLLLAVGTGITAGTFLALPALAQPAVPPGDPRMAERSIGSVDAPVVVREFFSLTCPHCAAFHRETMPRVHKDLIDTGKLRMVFHDFPLDQLALTAAAVARALPPERYEPFAAALLASQDRWAFARGVNAIEELWKMAALAGLSRPTFDAAVNDQALKQAILTAQDADSKTYKIESTPSFVFNGPNAKNRVESGAKPYDEFARLVAAAA
jgi:protein-disulfide isomerase